MKINITLWWQLNAKTNQYDFNHIEDGHCHNDVPTVKFDSQKGWKSCKWKKQHATLENGLIYE